jgi:hypothetical protein
LHQFDAGRPKPACFSIYNNYKNAKNTNRGKKMQTRINLVLDAVLTLFKTDLTAAGCNKTQGEAFSYRDCHIIETYVNQMDLANEKKYLLDALLYCRSLIKTRQQSQNLVIIRDVGIALDNVVSDLTSYYYNASLSSASHSKIVTTLQNFAYEMDLFCKRLTAQQRFHDVKSVMPVQEAAGDPSRNKVILVRKYTKHSTVDLRSADSRDMNFWFFKLIQDTDVLLRELITMELRRFLTGNGPKTRLGRSTDNVHGLLSKKVKGFQSFHNIFNKLTTDQLAVLTFTHAAEAYVNALVLEEVDLTETNLGLDPEGNVVHLDGDWAMASLTDKKYRPRGLYSEEDVVSLPFIKRYAPHNWLGLVRAEKVRQPHQEAVMTRAYQIDALNKFCGIMKILVLPDSFFKNFVLHYHAASKETVKIAAWLLSRQAYLRQIILANQDFQRYLTSIQAAEDFRNYANQAEVFKTLGKKRLTAQDPTLVLSMQKNFFAMQASPAIVLSIRNCLFGNPQPQPAVKAASLSAVPQQPVAEPDEQPAKRPRLTR